jgi:hypothetical protein
MAYGHADRNLALIRQLETETRNLLEGLGQLTPEQSAWLREVAGPDRWADSPVQSRNSDGGSLTVPALA